MKIKDKKLKGSLTVEAALVLPIFLFAMISILYLIEFVKIQTLVSQTIYNKSMLVASYGYSIKQLDNEKFYELTSQAKDFMGESYFENCIKEELDKNILAKSLFDGNINFSNSKIMKGDGYLKFDIRYKLKTPFSFLGIPSIKCKKNILAHSWVGYENDFDNKNDYYVYITPHGTVYHESPTCSYINISANATPIIGIDSLRNASGGKYYLCSKCGGRISIDGLAYITLYGDRYHIDKNCSEINREVKKVKLSEVGGRHACSKCKK